MTEQGSGLSKTALDIGLQHYFEFKINLQFEVDFVLKFELKFEMKFELEPEYKFDLKVGIKFYCTSRSNLS